MNYLDFQLVIGAGAGKGRVYPVYVIGSPAGEAYEFMEFPFNDRELDNQLQALQYALRSSGKYRKILSPEEQTVQNFGRALFDALFIKEVRSRYDVSQDRAFTQGMGLRIKLHIQTPALASLPWEFLYDKRIDKYICLSNNSPIVRYLELSKPNQSLTVTPPLSILGMVANPKDLSDLEVDREKDLFEKSIERLRNDGLVQLNWLPGRTWQDLQRAMRRGPWHIFHFIGHGDFDAENDEGLIFLEDEEGNAYPFPATQLARLLTDHYSLRLIVLNSCDGARSSKHDIFSSTAAILVKHSVSAVLAMQYEITNTAAIELSRAFYEALTEGLPVDTAVAEARKAISMLRANTLEWGTPVLYMRSPDGILFNLPHKNFNNNIGAANLTKTYSAPPIDEQIALWLDKSASNSHRTREVYTTYITKFREILCSNELDLDSEDDNKIILLYRQWAPYSDVKDGKKLAPATINLRRTTLSSFYGFATTQQWRKDNPLRNEEKRKVEKKPATPFTPETVTEGLNTIDLSTLEGKRDIALLMLLFTTGRLVSEAAGLRCGDIVRDDHEVWITFRRIKGGSMMKMPLDAITVRLLDDYLAAAYPTNGYSSESPLWLSLSHNNYRGAISVQAIADICKKRLGTSKVQITRSTYQAMTQGLVGKEIVKWLNLSGALH